MTYLNTQELPWDMDMPHKKQHQKKVCVTFMLVLCDNKKNLYCETYIIVIIFNNKISSQKLYYLNYKMFS